MMTYGEIKAELPSITIEALDDLKKDCIKNIEDEVLVEAEQDLLRYVLAELHRRRNG